MNCSNIVVIYTDGACRGNPGIGGWGAILECCGKEETLSGMERQTTNNRMELTAAIRALQAINGCCEAVKLTTDSKYVKNGITLWMPRWKTNGWRTANRKPVKNVDLWKELDDAVHALKERCGVSVEWGWIKGHSGHEGNERADSLANEAIDRAPAGCR